MCFQDLSDYKYDKMVVKSLDILNKMYSSQHDMFRLANKAQVWSSLVQIIVAGVIQSLTPRLWDLCSGLFRLWLKKCMQIYVYKYEC